ncbi:Precorrin-2 C(20)-methyltransferase [Candidatus Hodgkinia cicadicola]|nr:Precorrin-2 C(20)-methyltransferase [Candidatus Hodgkinia cicadicola]
MGVGQLNSNCGCAGFKILTSVKVVIWPIYLSKYCICKAFATSKINLNTVKEAPVFMFLNNYELYESWKVCLCCLCLLKANVACVCVGNTKVFSSTIKLFKDACYYHRYRLISGFSIINVARPLAAGGFACFIKRVDLEWFKHFSVCLNFILFLKLSLELSRSIILKIVFKLFGLSSRTICVLSSCERVVCANVYRYFSIVCLNKL